MCHLGNYSWACDGKRGGQGRGGGVGKVGREGVGKGGRVGKGWEGRERGGEWKG